MSEERINPLVVFAVFGIAGALLAAYSGNAMVQAVGGSFAFLCSALFVSRFM